jgi:hypothetical protein
MTAALQIPLETWETNRVRTVSSSSPAGDLDHEAEAQRLLKTYRLASTPIFIVGTFDTGITVLSQQVRALNLAWSLVDSGTVPTGTSGLRTRIAIVGAGFAGMTVAAGLLRKGVNADLTVFERQDTVMPLQQGSDSRWLHPHIYDWPRDGSESYSAALPVLNWTASRASDVVVQVLAAWRSLIESPPKPVAEHAVPASIRIFCNTQHLQVDSTDGVAKIEWVGDPREPADPSVPLEATPSARGDSQEFDIVILTVGFGLEREATTSYWRNETFAQPQLGQARSTYIVSGAGDGAMIDLFRLRISQFRQDRILSDLFARTPRLLGQLRKICTDEDAQGQLFETLNSLWNEAEFADETFQVLQTLGSRLRHDTHVILHFRDNPNFAARLDGKRRISFQNRLLAFLLFRCGGFFPSSRGIKELAREHAVPAERIINRHGTQTGKVLKDVLAKSLHAAIEAALEEGSERLRQNDEIHWTGGYFDMVGKTSEAAASQETKGHWRKEYLPSPTQSMATTLCATIAGHLLLSHPREKRLRVTLHRTLLTGTETVLQQCCEYQGVAISSRINASRTFPTTNATIGAAFTHQKIVRSRGNVDKQAIDADMRDLHLNEASREMADTVRSVAAIPLLRDTDSLGAAAVGSSPRPSVVGVIYLDSEEDGYFANDTILESLIEMSNAFLRTINDQTQTVAGRIANSAFWTGKSPRATGREAILRPADWRALELVEVEPPSSKEVHYLNYDFSDFAPIEQALP